VATVQELQRRAARRSGWSVGEVLASVLYAEIDRLVVKLSPLTIGYGIPLFSPAVGLDLRTWSRTEHTELDSGVVCLRA
jgi:hypothetical protein